MTSPEQGGASQSRRTDLISLVIAVILLVIAGIGIGGQTWWLIPNLLPWIIAGIAALVGLGLIVSSLPGRRTKHQ
jgi:hypothetical protein